MAHGSGVRVEIETKATRGRLRPAQERWASWVRSHGGIYLLAQPGRGESEQQAVDRCAAEVLAAVRART